MKRINRTNRIDTEQDEWTSEPKRSEGEWALSSTRRKRFSGHRSTIAKENHETILRMTHYSERDECYHLLPRIERDPFFSNGKIEKERPTLAHVWEPVKILFVKKSFVCAQFACQVAFDGLNWILRRQRDAQKKWPSLTFLFFFGFYAGRQRCRCVGDAGSSMQNSICM